MLKMICWDMDGTIADLYGVKGWLSMLRQENPTPYIKAEPIWDMKKLRKIMLTAQNMGIEIHIITWLSRNSSEEYKNKVREAKKNWLAKMNFPYDYFHSVAYGATKADSVRRYLADNENAILIDDNEKVRQGWHMGDTINPTDGNLLETLENMLVNLKNS